MIPGTFILAGVLTATTGWLFSMEALNVVLLTVAWVVIFFFASAAASSGYLTVSETFPMEIRAMVIAFFYAIATAVGGILGPYFFGNLIATETRGRLLIGYLVGAGVMVLAGLVHRILGVAAEQRSLEDIAAPLSLEEARGPRAGNRRRPRSAASPGRRKASVRNGRARSPTPNGATRRRVATRRCRWR